jgi:hypothetical protein
MTVYDPGVLAVKLEDVAELTRMFHERRAATGFATVGAF